MHDTEIAVYSLTEVRTLAVSGRPDTVVLKITSGNDTRHYSLKVGDLEVLAKQLRNDALLLAE